MQNIGVPYTRDLVALLCAVYMLWEVQIFLRRAYICLYGSEFMSL